jgi:hypothetical protein
MHPHAFLVTIALFGWVYRGTKAEICAGQVCVDSSRGTCGAAERNTSLPYQRRVNDCGTMGSNLALSIMQGPSVVETFGGSPGNDWLNATYVNDKHDTYMIPWNFRHGDEASVAGAPILTYSWVEEFCTPSWIVVAEDGCSIIKAHSETNEASGRNESSLSYVVWFAFAVCVGLSALDMIV